MQLKLPKLKHLYYLILTIIVGLLLFNSCAYKKSSCHSVAKNINSSIFIEMPENVLVFENIADTIYTCIWRRFKQLGYNLIKTNKNAFTLKIKIKGLANLHKLVSSDVIMYSEQMKLELLCKIFDKNNKLIIEKNFYFPFMRYKAKRAIMDPDYFKYTLREIMEKRAAPKIERYLRKYWT